MFYLKWSSLSSESSAIALGLIDRHTGALLIVPAIEEGALLQQEEPILAVVVVVAIIRMRIYVHGVPLALLARANCRCLWNAKVIYEFPDMLR